jgi:hypothetical protein
MQGRSYTWTPDETLEAVLLLRSDANCDLKGQAATNVVPRYLPGVGRPRRELALDELEGADVLMVKPALPYLDVVADAREAFDVPIAAYQVSGEYAMVRAAGERGWLDGDRAMRESVLAIRRAGADVVLTYAALELAGEPPR